MDKPVTEQGWALKVGRVLHQLGQGLTCRVMGRGCSGLAVKQVALW